MASSAGEEEYIMASDPEEVTRLTDQHKLIKDHMGALVLAPLDLSQPNLRILDSATADGGSYLHSPLRPQYRRPALASAYLAIFQKTDTAQGTGSVTWTLR